MSNETVCRCGHQWVAHQHHRRGTDCALCETCPKFRRRWTAGWLRIVRRRP